MLTRVWVLFECYFIKVAQVWKRDHLLTEKKDLISGKLKTLSETITLPLTQQIPPPPKKGLNYFFFVCQIIFSG